MTSFAERGGLKRAGKNYLRKAQWPSKARGTWHLSILSLRCSSSATTDKEKLKSDRSIDGKSHLITQYPNGFDEIRKFERDIISS